MSEKSLSETPYLHVRPPRRVVGVGGEGESEGSVAFVVPEWKRDEHP